MCRSSYYLSSISFLILSNSSQRSYSSFTLFFASICLLITRAGSFSFTRYNTPFNFNHCGSEGTEFFVIILLKNREFYFFNTPGRYMLTIILSIQLILPKITSSIPIQERPVVGFLTSDKSKSFGDYRPCFLYDRRHFLICEQYTIKNSAHNLPESP